MNRQTGWTDETWTPEPAERPDTLLQPLRWRKPRRAAVRVALRSGQHDLFADEVSDRHLARVFATMAASPRHTFVILTARTARMRALLGSDGFSSWVAQRLLSDLGEVLRCSDWPLRNVWLGAPVENQEQADARIPDLAGTPAAARMVATEPLRGPLDLSRWLGIEYFDSFGWGPEMLATLSGRGHALDWVVAAGGRGPEARPVHPEWLRSLRDQCQAAPVPFWFDGWGAWAPAGRGIGMAKDNVGREELVGPALDDMGQRQVMRRAGRRTAGRTLDGRTWQQAPNPAQVQA
ncbi:MAG TPA: DUF5131 family protein [Streptomyces sp.]